MSEQTTPAVSSPGCYCADCVEGWPGGQAAEVLADFRAAFSNRDESAWLIERRVSPPQWWVEERPTGVGAFFPDVHRAYRFQTRDAAESAMRQMCITPEERSEYFVSEHMWIATPSARITGDKDRENPVEGAPLAVEARNRLRLWFFRECNIGTRRQLFSIFGLPLDEIRNEGAERLCFEHILAAIGTQHAG